MIRFGAVLACTLIMLVGLSGCGNSDKGKNREKDVEIKGPPELPAPSPKK